MSQHNTRQTIERRVTMKTFFPKRNITEAVCYVVVVFDAVYMYM